MKRKKDNSEQRTTCPEIVGRREYCASEGRGQAESSGRQAM